VDGLTFPHPHLPAALLNHAENARVRNGVLDSTTRIVDILQLLIVLRLIVHLDLERVDFEQ
jgi:hypothetical protein